MCDFVSGFDNLNLTVNTDMVTVVKAMAQPDSGLEIRDRMWLKITIPNAFIGMILSKYLVVSSEKISPIVQISYRIYGY